MGPEDSDPTSTDDTAPVYLVVGASGGVGSDLCKRLGARGAKVIYVGRDEAEISAAASEARSKHFVCDATDFGQMKFIESSRSIYGRLDGVVNCVGSILLKPAHLTTETEWTSVISTNLTSAFLVLRGAAKAMMGHGGSIVLISSCAANVGLPNHEAIAAAKAGIEGMVRSAAATYARHKIRVNCVAPGLLATKMSHAMTSNETQLQASADMHPLGRIGSSSDVSSVIDWLFSEESAWITGQSFAVDGGISSVRSSRPQR